MAYEITNFHGIYNYPTLTNALFGAVKRTKNADIDKYKYSGYEIGFDGHGFYSHPRNGTGLCEHLLFTEKMYSINFTKENTKFCLSLKMEQTVTCLLMVQKFINLPRKILKLFQIICA